MNGRIYAHVYDACIRELVTCTLAGSTYDEVFDNPAYASVVRGDRRALLDALDLAMSATAASLYGAQWTGDVREKWN